MGGFLKTGNINPKYTLNSLEEILKERCKRGGPYTRKEREERQLEVFRLHFEGRLPATKIASILDVNRNTIDDDISFWKRQLSHEFDQQDLLERIIKQIHRTELQRERLMEYLERAQGIGEELAIERLISDIDVRLEKLHSSLLKHEESELVKRVERLEQLARLSQENRGVP